MANLRKLAGSSAEFKGNVARRIGQVVASLVLFALLLFVSAGRVNWLQAWLYLVGFCLISLIGLLFVPLEVVAERGSTRKSDVERWDTVIVKLLVVSTLPMYVVAGLNYRWQWSPTVPAGLRLASAAVFVSGCALEIWAMSANRFFSSSVRIQPDRGHVVCSKGPYRWVRHPGYLGMILYTLASPVFLGSLWAMLPALATAGIFVARTWMEDRTLREKLPGYVEYAARTRYRLLPGLW
jgi:protein-S-isoprenylcysteine O-methyltransferase Ste14